MSRFSEEYVELKRKIVNIYEVERGLTEGLNVIKAEQQKDLRDAVGYIKRKIDNLQQNLHEMIAHEKKLLSNGTGLKMFCTKTHLQKLEELDAELDTVKEMHVTLVDSMKKQGL